MELSTLLGLILGFGMLLFGFLLEGGELHALFLLAPAIIVFGGTIGALLVSYNMKDVKKLPRLVKSTMTAHKSSEDELIDAFVRLGESARKEGLLSLEGIVDKEYGSKFDPMLKEGVKMVVDGTDAELVKSMFENQLYIHDQLRKNEASMFEAAGGYSPTMGIIGTVMGLVHVLGNLSSPEELSKSIAGAFIATLYGVCFANLVYLPMASKLKQKAKQEAAEKQLIMEGVLSIQAGENPSIIRRKLQTFKLEDNGGQVETVPVEEAAVNG
jgi:chemotaxis protein MotA